MRHAAFSLLQPFSILFFSVHSAKMTSEESSDSEMPHDSSDEEVWEKEEVSGDDDTITVDLDFPIQLDGHLAFMWCKYFVYTRLSVK